MSLPISLLVNLSVLGGGAMALLLLIPDMRLSNQGLFRRCLFGAILGVISLVVVQLPIEAPYGATFDTRAAPVILATAFGGPIPGFIAATLGAVGRYQVGGAFVWGGITSFFIYFSAGWLAHKWLRNKQTEQLGFSGLLVVAVGASAAAASCFFIGVEFEKGLMIFQSYSWIMLVGNVIGVIVMGTAIERARVLFLEKDRLIAEADSSHAEIQQILNALPCLIGYWDKSQRNLFVNRQSEEWLGTSSEAIHGRSIRDILGDETYENSRLHIEAALIGKPQKFKRDSQLLHNQYRSMEIQYLPRFHENEVIGFYSLAIDISDSENAKRQIEHAAQHDILTGLPNRAYLNTVLPTMLSQAVEKNQRFAIMCIDLDDFKQVNDTNGHSTGDALLKIVAERLNKIIRKNDFVFRLGGDEFGFCLIEDDGLCEIIDRVAGRIINEIGKPYLIEEREFRIGVSVGVAIAPDHGSDIPELMRNADLALYNAKNTGKNKCCVFNHQLARVSADRKTRIEELRQAVDCEQFELHYQPFHNFRNNKICGAEALVRWRHPRSGLVSPAEFIPLTEELGLIGKLGEWVLKSALRDASDWPCEISLAVNVSAAQFGSDSLYPFIKQALDETGVNPARLELEVTESIFIQNPTDVFEEICALKSLGIKISIDDFGTGFSSLRKLIEFPFDKIKIDRSFVADMVTNQESLAIISSVIGLAKNLNMEVTAEGIETDEQFQLLAASQCTFGQGYLIARPMPSAEINKIFSGNQTQQKLRSA